jgi:multicomponent Na+:H+ antiporter subunit G
MPSLFEIIIALQLMLGTFIMVLMGIGVVRFPDTFCRMHASGKGGTLGVIFIIIPTIIFFFGTPNDIWIHGILAIFFQFLTTPASTHLLAQAAYLCHYQVSDRTEVDELRNFVPSMPDQVFNQE